MNDPIHPDYVNRRPVFDTISRLETELANLRSEMNVQQMENLRMKRAIRQLLDCVTFKLGAVLGPTRQVLPHKMATALRDLLASMEGE